MENSALDAGKRAPWQVGVVLTFLMSLATSIDTGTSSYFFLFMKTKEAAVDRWAKGAQLRCEKLEASAPLAVGMSSAPTKAIRASSLV